MTFAVKDLILPVTEGPDVIIREGMALGLGEDELNSIAIYKANNVYIAHISVRSKIQTIVRVVSEENASAFVDDAVECLGHWAPALKKALLEASASDSDLEAVSFLHF